MKKKEKKKENLVHQQQVESFLEEQIFKSFTNWWPSVTCDNFCYTQVEPWKKSNYFRLLVTKSNECWKRSKRQEIIDKVWGLYSFTPTELQQK